MKSFKEYAKQTDANPTAGQTAQNAEGGNSSTTANAEDLAKQIARAYNGKSNAAMLKNILLQAEKSKRAGTLSNEEIERFYQSFAPMLDAVQRRKLRSIVDKLKEI
ncbi:MAG: hypothetical protein IJ308_05990 [Clostridia bacterium]|nr:hypothetical protein [Clostridia bacterium]